ncbi:hypothetical protein, partial [Ensifer oleiphilus]|uniref:hypothetical protein n=1 Tax=Ensifer oleiphilus TaxID=2742698 RepID=UPI001AEEC2F0
DIVASSAAALVSDRAYRPHTSNTSTDNFKKLTRNDNQLKIKGKFERRLSTGRARSRKWRRACPESLSRWSKNGAFSRKNACAPPDISRMPAQKGDNRADRQVLWGKSCRRSPGAFHRNVTVVADGAH